MVRQVLASLLHRLRVDQRGMAVPTALFATIAGMGLVTAAALSTVSAQRGTAGDQDRKSAIAAADAGANLALLRQNKVHSSSGFVASPCIGVGSGGTLTGTSPAADGWCPAVSGTVGGATYVYRVSPYTANAATVIVSTGTADGISRRIAVQTRLASGSDIFEGEGAIGKNFVLVDGDGDIEANVGSNGNVTMSGGSATICGNIRHGVGGTISGSGQCLGYQTSEGSRDLPPLSEAKRQQLATSNSNFRFTNGADTYTGHGSFWDATTRTLSTEPNSTLTLGGGDYFVCRMNLQGNLIMAAGAQARIFFDTPEACGQTAGVRQLEMSSQASISSTGWDPAAGLYNLPGFYFFGSPNIDTVAYVRGGASANEFLLYGPNTTVDAAGNSDWIGAVAAKSIYLHGTGGIVAPDGLQIPFIDIPPKYARDRYVECVGATATPPNANC